VYQITGFNAASDMIFAFMSNKYACCAMGCTSLALQSHALMLSSDAIVSGVTDGGKGCAPPSLAGKM